MLKKIDAATDDELKAFATTKGLSFAPNIGRAKLEEKIKAVIEGDEIDVPEDASGDPAKDAAVKSKSQIVGGQGDDFVWVMIALGQGDGGDAPVDLYCNGKQTWVPRGKWCRIRTGYFSSLKDAVEEKYDQFKDPETGLMKISDKPRMAPRYPYSVWTSSGEPPKEQQYIPGEAVAGRPQAA